MEPTVPQFDQFFHQATGQDPFPYQLRFATHAQLPALVNIPTGMGKTAMAVLGWLWCLRFASEFMQDTPRRLVYCLPMRVLVEQTYEATKQWLDRVHLRRPRRRKGIGTPSDGWGCCSRLGHLS